MSSFDSLRLGDGRRIDFEVTGGGNGPVLVFHHGTPGAGTSIGALDRAAVARGLRVVWMSRAGYGGSDRLAGRNVVDVVGDTAEVLRAVGAGRCLVAGWSGGGPHALACAARLDSTAAALVLSGVAPYSPDGLDWWAGMGEDNVAEFSAAVEGESTLRPHLEGLREHLKEVSVDNLVGSLDSLLPAVDRAVLTHEFGQDMADGFREGLRNGVDGWLDDDLAFTSPWGFDVSEVGVPVTLWQGSEDLMVPYSHGQWLASHVPGVSAHLEAGEGHLSVGLGSLESALDELLAAGGI